MVWFCMIWSCLSLFLSLSFSVCRVSIFRRGENKPKESGDLHIVQCTMYVVQHTAYIYIRVREEEWNGMEWNSIEHWIARQCNTWNLSRVKANSVATFVAFLLPLFLPICCNILSVCMLYTIHHILFTMYIPVYYVYSHGLHVLVSTTKHGMLDYINLLYKCKFVYKH